MSDVITMMAFQKVWEACDTHFPSRNEFLASYLRQNFSLPDSMIYYILKNPASSKMYQKLIQCCKHFFIKNPIVVLHCFQIDEDGGWKCCSNDCRNRKPLEKANAKIESIVACKIWIQDRLDILSTSPKDASDLIANIYQCDAEVLFLRHQKLSQHQLCFYSQYTRAIDLQNVVIISVADHSEMPIEDIIANLPNIKRFALYYDPSSTTNVSKDTVEKLIQIPHFKNVDYFALACISEKFDIDRFYNYYKNQKSKFFFGVHYQNMPSEDYAKKLDQYVDEMLTFKFPDCLISYIRYPGQDIAKRNALWKLHEKSWQPY